MISKYTLPLEHCVDPRIANRVARESAPRSPVYEARRARFSERFALSLQFG
jgi:hypothetical protein